MNNDDDQMLWSTNCIGDTTKIVAGIATETAIQVARKLTVRKGVIA